jgi:hypothetical protein
MGYRTQQQSITATNQFDGTAPTGTPTIQNDKKSYPAQATGGLFDFGITVPHHVVGIELYGLAGGGTETWKIEKQTAEGDVFTIAEGTTQDQYVLLKKDRFLLREQEKIKVTTGNMTGAMSCMVSVDRDIEGGTH